MKDVVFAALLAIVLLAQAPANRVMAIAAPHQSQTTNILTVSGRIALDQPIIAAAFEVSGRVQAVNVAPGQLVKKGDVLAEIDATDLNDALTQAQEAFALKQAEQAHGNAAPSASEINRAKRELASAVAAYEKLKNGGNPHDIEQALRSWNQDKNSLWGDQLTRDETCGLIPGSSTEEDFKQANLDLECKKKTLDVQIAELKEQASRQAYEEALKPGTPLAIAQSWATVAQARASLASVQRGPNAATQQVNAAELAQSQVVIDRAQREVEKATLRSPCDCVVQQVGLSAGSLADGNITLLDDSTLTFEAVVNERNVARIAPGQPVTISLYAVAQPVPGKVANILPLPVASQTASAAYIARIDIDVDTVLQDALLAGMTGKAEIQLTLATNANIQTQSAQPTTTSAPSASGIVALAVLTSTPGFAKPGVVTSVAVRPGQTVKKGDVLATIDDAPLQDAVVDAQLALDLLLAKLQPDVRPASNEDIAAAQAVLHAAQLAYEATKAGPTQRELINAKRNVDSAWLSYIGAQISRDVHCGTPAGLEAHECKTEEVSYGNAFESWAAAVDSYNKLLDPVDTDALAQANEAVVSAREKLASLKSPESATATVLADTQIVQAKSALERAQRKLADAKLLSPCDCVVQQVNVAVDAKSPAEAFVLVDLTRLQFAVALNEQAIARIKPGQSATIRLSAFAQPFSGKVKTVLAQRVDNTGDAALFTVLIDLDPTITTVLPGMSGDAQIEIQ